MAEKTGISWTDSTFNPWIGCTKVGPGCDNCYAEALMDKRWHKVQWGTGQQRQRTSAANWRQPLLWEKEHAAFALMHGRRRRVFCASLADVFDNQVPAAWRADLFALIEATPHLDWLLLTKRIGNVPAMMVDVAASLFWMDRLGTGQLPPNVWLGATVVNQQESDRDVPKLLSVLAETRFLSVEPMLGPIDLERPRPGPDLFQGSGSLICQPWLIQSGIDWVIVGGESGPNARPIKPEWVDSLHNQCGHAGVPFFFKQWGGKSATAGGCELAGAEVKAWPVAA